MSDQDLFNSNEGTPASEHKAASEGEGGNDPIADLLGAIRNEEGKPKYDSVQKALEALKHSQEHIRRLEEESKARAEEIKLLRDKEASMESVDEVVNRLLAAKEEEQVKNLQETPKSDSVNEDAVSSLVRKMLEEEKMKSIVERNTSEVMNKLRDKFGEKAKEIVVAKAEELGITPQMIGTLASQSPKAALALFNIESVARSAGPAAGSVNLPLNPGERELEPPKLEKSILQGVTMKEQMEAFRRSREYTNKRLGINN